jgi:hypothetical protein
VTEHPQFEGGGMRETQDGKPRFDLLLPLNVPFDDQLLTRWARHMAESLKKYPERNWEEFADVAALDRCRASAFRHFMQWLLDPSPKEDHAAAVLFNIMAAEYVQGRLEGKYGV